MFGDVTGLQQPHQPQNVPYLVEEIKGFPLKVKSIFKYYNMRKTQGKGSSNPPPLYDGGSMTLVASLRVK